VGESLMTTAKTTHIAGEHITIEGRWLRQRCSWCGYVILDYDLSLTASNDGKGPHVWTAGSLVDISGVNPIYSALNQDDALSDTFCGAAETFGANPATSEVCNR